VVVTAWLIDKSAIVRLAAARDAAVDFPRMAPRRFPAAGTPALGGPDKTAAGGKRLLDDIATIDGFHQDMIAAELALQHRERFAQTSDLYRPRTAALIRRGQSVSPGRLPAACAHRLAFRGRLRRVMDAERIDLWICPSAPDVAPRGLEATGSPAMNMPWTHAGLPALSLPAGQGAAGLPLGLQLVGRYGEDERLLAWAGAIEQMFPR